MLLLAVQLIMGRTRPWVPEKWKEKQFDLIAVQKVVKAGGALATAARGNFSTPHTLCLR